jgi:hypothetical protein
MGAIWDELQFTFKNGAAELIPVEASEKGFWIDVKVNMVLTTGEKASIRMVVHRNWDKPTIHKMIERHYMNDKKFWENNREERKLILPNAYERN